MPRVVGIDHLVLSVGDFMRSKAFYGKLLGFLLPLGCSRPTVRTEQPNSQAKHAVLHCAPIGGAASIKANLDRLRGENVFGKVSRSRVGDVLAIFRQRFLGEESVWVLGRSKATKPNRYSRQPI
jgi:catechol 2,3-dioxygenase-like lactoylglutathione lyase family enzyme